MGDYIGPPRVNPGSKTVSEKLSFLKGNDQLRTNFEEFFVFPIIKAPLLEISFQVSGKGDFSKKSCQIQTNSNFNRDIIKSKDRKNLT